MASSATYLSVTRETYEEIISVDSRLVVNEFYEISDHLGDENRLCIYEAWDALVRCLGNGRLRGNDDFVEVRSVYGDSTVWLRSPYVRMGTLVEVRVKEIVLALQRFPKLELRKRYFALKRTFMGIDVSSYGAPVSQQDWEFVESHFEQLVTFMERSAKSNHCVVMVISG